MVDERIEGYTITTKNLVIKPTTIADASFLYQLFNTPDWLKFIGDRNVHSPADAANYIRDRILTNKHPLPVGSYIVFLKENNMPVGTVGIYQRDSLDAPDIGFAFLPEYCNRGLAYEASFALMQQATARHQLQQLYAITLEENLASRKLLEKLGLHYLKKIEMADDKEMLMLYALY